MVPYSVNVRAREKMIYCVVINKDMETYLFYINNVKQIVEQARSTLQNNMCCYDPIFVTKSQKKTKT